MYRGKSHIIHLTFFKQFYLIIYILTGHRTSCINTIGPILAKHINDKTVWPMLFKKVSSNYCVKNKIEFTATDGKYFLEWLTTQPVHNHWARIVPWDCIVLFSRLVLYFLVLLWVCVFININAVKTTKLLRHKKLFKCKIYK